MAVVPSEGRDYLVDYYAVLGVPRDASREQIQARYRASIKGLHSDRFGDLDERVAALAGRLIRHATAAYEVLERPDRRAAYDAQLAAWGERPLSSTGDPVVSLKDLPRMRFRQLTPELVATHTSEAVALGRRMHPERTGALDRARARLDADPSEENREDFLAALQVREATLAIEESLRAEQALGVDVDSLPAGERHLAALSSALADAAAKRAQVLGERELGTAQQHLALGVGDSEANGAELALAAARTTTYRFEQFFAEQEVLVRQLADQRTELSREWLEALRLTYEHPSDPRQARVAISVEAGLRSMWLCVQFDEARSTADDAYGSTDEPVQERLVLSGLTPEIASELRQAGVNVARLTVADGFDLDEQVNAALAHHFDEWFAERLPAAGGRDDSTQRRTRDGGPARHGSGDAPAHHAGRQRGHREPSSRGRVQRSAGPAIGQR